jgi:hypothetical protein
MQTLDSVALESCTLVLEQDTEDKAYRMYIFNGVSDTIFLKVLGTEMPTLEERSEAAAALYNKMAIHLTDSITVTEWQKDA